MKFGKINISKEWLIKLAVFTVLAVAAVLIDAYLDKNPTEINTVESTTTNQNPGQGEMYVLAQPVTFSAKTLVQKNTERKIQIEAHNKFLRNFHSVRNFQVFKAEVIHQTTPIINSYHYLVFLNHLFSPDEDPLS